jgi:hypothetical protein
MLEFFLLSNILKAQYDKSSLRKTQNLVAHSYAGDTLAGM